MAKKKKSEIELNEKAQANVKTNFTAQGKSGTLVSSGVIEDDYIQELIGVEGQIIYGKMVNSDAQIRKLYHSVTNPIKSAVWSIEPASDDELDLKKAALIDKILFQNLPDGWISFLDECLTFPWHGHAVFEKIHANYVDPEIGPYTGLLNLAFRDQSTLDKWNFDTNGILKTIHQKQSGDLEVDKDLATDILLIFYNEKKGNNNGFAFCRMLYGNYKRKLLYKQLQAIGIERGAIGTPTLKIPKGVGPQDPAYIACVANLEAYVQAENSYVIFPDGYEIDFKNQSTFDPSKIQSAIKAENEEISGSLVAMWLEMGIGGNSAVGSSTQNSADFFRKGIEYIADKVVQVINRQLIPELIAMNFPGDTGPMPELAYSGISDSDGESLMRIVTGYVEKGVIQPDTLLEDHIRALNNLPKRPEGDTIDQDPKDVQSENDDDSGNDDTPVDNDAELNDKQKKGPIGTIEKGAKKVSEVIVEQLNFSAHKYINDVLKKYKNLPDSRKQKAIEGITIAGEKNLSARIKSSLIQTWNEALTQVKKEVPGHDDVKLSSSEMQLNYMRELVGEDFDKIKLNEFSALPTHAQILLSSQASLIAADSINELKKRLNFTFSSNQLKTDSEAIIRQTMDEAAESFINGNTVAIKGDNVSALVVNESRNSFFFADDVVSDIHSLTFVNGDPKALVCRELAGKSFSPNDAESMLYAPPLHHGCKSTLRANLKSSRGLERIIITTLSPSEEAKKSVTL